MALALGPTESADSVEADYSSWQLETVPVAIRIHRDVIDGISRDILEHPGETATGLLRGRGHQGDPSTLWIEGFERSDAASPASVAHPDDVNPSDVIGSYSSSAAIDLQAVPEGSWGFLLCVAPDSSGALLAQCYLRGATGNLEPVLPVLLFQERTAEAAESDKPPENVKHRRLVPDFDPAGEAVRPSRELFLHSQPDRDADSDTRRWIRKAWPVFGALLLVGGVVWALVQLQDRNRATAPSPGTVQTEGAVRPLGLYVDPGQQTWRVSWNRDATVLRDAKGVRLFVQDGDDQNLLDLSRQDLDSGTCQYQPRGRDVTFRLEATDKDGRLSAESFRVLKTAAAELAKSPPAVVSSNSFVPPKATHRVAPVVAANVRPRIRGKIPIDVRVQIDNRGRVTSAIPSKRPHAELEKYLTDRAVRAARGWHFNPATTNGKPVSGTETIHFVFER